MDDTELINKAQAGDAASFAMLIEKHYDTIYRFAFKWCGNRTDAQDITQQCCLLLARNLRQFRFESAFTSWLYTLVINCSRDWHRAQQRHKGTDIDELPEEAINDDRQENSVYLQQILHLLDGMAEGFKETAILVHSLGLSHAEAADILGIKESTVSWRLHEIRQHFHILRSGEVRS